MCYSKYFIAIQKEAMFTKDLLGSGVTQIRKADYSQKGLYFQAFTNLSTGIERIGKLSLILEYYINNSGTFPSTHFLKNDIGHDLTKLYSSAKEIIKKRSLTFSFNTNLDSTIHLNIIKILSDFAKGDRYSNINLLSNDNFSTDPIKEWHNNVDMLIYRDFISEKKKKLINNNAKEISEFSKEFTIVFHTSEEGMELKDVESASQRTGIKRAIEPYRQLHVLQIIRFWVQLIYKLRHFIDNSNQADIPEFGDIYGRFFNPDSYFKSRKVWDFL